MKNEILLRWLSMTGLLAGIVLLASYFWILPACRQLHQIQHQVIQQQQRYQQVLTPLRQQPALQALQMRNQQLLEEMVREGQPFSLYGLLQQSGGELEHWQPDRQDNQLQLWLAWPQLKALFAYLAACEPAPALTSFIVQRKVDRLHAIFHLAFDNETSY